MISVKDAWYSYDERTWVLRGASLQLREARIVAIVGPNGAGKTTLMKVAALLYKPQRGTVIAWGRLPWSDGSLTILRRQVVYVHEKPLMLRGSVADNIAYGLLLRGFSRSEVSLQVQRIAKRMGIESILSKPARRLSTGQAQMVALARALVLEPKILLLDEPFAHLDSRKRKMILSILRELREQGTGIAIATHDTYLAAKIADEAVYVEDGCTKRVNTLDELYA